MLPSGCGTPAMPMKLSVLMSASVAFTSADTRASSATFTFSMAPSRVLSESMAPSTFSIWPRMRAGCCARAAVAARLNAMAAAATAALAQQPGRIRGQIEKVDGAMLSLKTRDGAMLNVKVADDARVSALVKASLADIKKDSFIGIAGVPETDGSIKAYSIHMFLPAQRGVVPDRHGPWDGRPNSTMTNAYVEDMVQSRDGDTLMVKY